MASCCFLGHAFSCSYSSAEYRANLTNAIENLIVNESVDTFYCGKRGDFDLLCWRITNELIKKYPHVKIYHVISYMPTEKDYNAKNTDTENIQTLYLLEEYVPPRYAIARTNQCMVDIADIILTGVNGLSGGANTALEYAEKKHKKIIYLDPYREKENKYEK